MAERWHTADRISGCDSRCLCVCLDDRVTRKAGQPVRLEPVGSAHQGNNRAAGGKEDERLDDLAERAADRPGRILGGPGALRETPDLEFAEQLF